MTQVELLAKTWFVEKPLIIERIFFDFPQGQLKIYIDFK
jgi:hypothetical protein